MRSKRTMVAAAVMGLAIVAAVWAAGPEGEVAQRAEAAKLYQQGNWKDAYAIYEKLATDPKTDPKLVAGDLVQAVDCLRRLGRQNELDAFREKAVEAQPKNWRLLWKTAETYVNGAHYGYMISGEFHRGRHRGGGQYVNSYERDRVRALQLMQQAIPNIRIDTDADRTEAGQFFLQLSDMLMGNRGYSGAWRLQVLTDLNKLPDYEKGYGYHGGTRGAPVDAAGAPIYYALPKSWADAANDGQRWRWALLQAREYDTKLTAGTKMRFADFLQHQFGVQTLASYSSFFYRAADTDEAGKRGKTGTWELHTLTDSETIAKLATGVTRFTLPEGFRYLDIYREVAAGTGDDAQQAADRIASIHENRRQYVTAAKDWQEAIKRFGPGRHEYRKKRLAQIVEPWGRFEPTKTDPAGAGASIQYRFRNGKKVKLTAHRIDVEKLIEDVKAYIRSKPKDSRGGRCRSRTSATGS